MTRRRLWVYFLLFLFNAICYIDRVNMSLAGHSVAQEFDLSPVALGYLFSSFLWAYVVMMLPSGQLVDRLGVHRMAAIGAAVWSVAQTLSGAAVGFTTLLLTRLGLGVGEAPTFPVSYRSRARLGPATERGRAVGCDPGRHLARPGARRTGRRLADPATSWRWSFVITGAIGLVWVAVWAAFVRTPERTRWLPEPERRRILAERHAGDPPPAHGGVGYRGLLARAVDVGARDLAGLRGLFAVSLSELAAGLSRHRAAPLDPEIGRVHRGAVPRGLGAGHADELGGRRHADPGHDAHRTAPAGRR